jgi:large subunit ribosomal protein L10
VDPTTKRELSSKLREELTAVSGFVLVGYKGMTVAESNALRGKFRDAGCHFRVYKNSTIRFAIADTPHEAAKDLLEGVSALAFHPEDPGAPARIVRDYAKENDKFFIKGGVTEGEALDASGVLRLASLPGPLELKAQLLALLNTPATQMVRVLNAPAQNLLNVLNAKKDKDAA